MYNTTPMATNNKPSKRLLAKLPNTSFQQQNTKTKCKNSPYNSLI